MRHEQGGRADRVEVELYEAGERVTYAGHRVLAHPLHGMRCLSPGERHAGIV